MYKNQENSIQTAISFKEFSLPFRGKLDGTNRWIQLSSLIPWARFEEDYARQFSEGMGAGALSFRIALGALIIKERLGLTDREAVEQIRENPYLQYFLGYKEFTTSVPFDPSMYVYFRKRISQKMLSEINEEIVLSSASKKVSSTQTEDDDNPPTIDSSLRSDDDKQDQAHQGGKLIIDSTCTPADIRHPTDLSILNEAREKSEMIIDCLWLHRSSHAPTGEKHVRIF